MKNYDELQQSFLEYVTAFQDVPNDLTDNEMLVLLEHTTLQFKTLVNEKMQ